MTDFRNSRIKTPFIIGGDTERARSVCVLLEPTRGERRTIVRKFWVPKSQIDADGTIPGWLLLAKIKEACVRESDGGIMRYEGRVPGVTHPVVSGY